MADELLLEVLSEYDTRIFQRTDLMLRGVSIRGMKTLRSSERRHKRLLDIDLLSWSDFDRAIYLLEMPTDFFTVECIDDMYKYSRFFRRFKERNWKVREHNNLEVQWENALERNRAKIFFATRSFNRIAAFAAGASAYVAFQEQSTPEGLAFAGAAYTYFLTSQQTNPLIRGALFTLSTALSSIPGIREALSYESSEGLEKVIGYGAIPVGNLVAHIWAETRKIPSDDEIISRIIEFSNTPSQLKSRLSKLSKAVREVELLRQHSAAYDESNREKLLEFERKCVGYLRDENSLREVTQIRLSLGLRSEMGAETSLRKESNTGLDSFATGLLKERRINHLKTYELARNEGIDRETSRRIARTVPYPKAERVVHSLRSAVEQDYKLLLQANPDLLFMKQGETGKYLHDLISAREAVAATFLDQVPYAFSLSGNPSIYASRDGLAVLVTSLTDGNKIEEDEIAQGLREESYDNLVVLKAILEKGFQLGTSKPRISMAYRPLIKIQSSSSHAVPAQDMAAFDDVFSQLVSDGVILTEKRRKTAAGAGGCYSITPHTQKIDKPYLRAFVRSVMYRQN